jgi:hypothetical protein
MARQLGFRAGWEACQHEFEQVLLALLDADEQELR